MGEFKPTPESERRAFQWQDTNGNFSVDASEIRDLEIPNANSFVHTVSDINNAGTVVGVNWFRNTGYRLAWELDGGTLRIVEHPDEVISTVVAINNYGLVVGESWTPSFGSSTRFVPFTWLSRKVETLTIPIDFGGAEAQDVNDLGWIAGSASDRDATGIFRHAIVWSPRNEVTDLHTAAFSSSQATAINASNKVVGTATTTGGTKVGFLWDSLGMRDLNELYPGLNMSNALDINDDDVILAITGDSPNRHVRLLNYTPASCQVGDKFSVEFGGRELASFELTNTLYTVSMDGVQATFEVVENQDSLVSFTAHGLIEQDMVLETDNPDFQPRIATLTQNTPIPDEGTTITEGPGPEVHWQSDSYGILVPASPLFPFGSTGFPIPTIPLGLSIPGGTSSEVISTLGVTNNDGIVDIVRAA